MQTFTIRMTFADKSVAHINVETPMDVKVDITHPTGVKIDILVESKTPLVEAKAPEGKLEAQLVEYLIDAGLGSSWDYLNQQNRERILTKLQSFPKSLVMVHLQDSTHENLRRYLVASRAVGAAEGW